jgi:hypothetical protein
MAANSFRSLGARVARLESATSGDDFLVVIIQNFSQDRVPYARIGGHGCAEISQSARESFDEFEARAIAAAKAAGDRFVAITLYRPLEHAA